MSFQYYMSVKGSKQGKIVGEPKKTSGRSEYIELTSFEFQTLAPIDSNSGAPVGKRTHKPVVITKEIGASTPQLFQAFCTQEILSEVVINAFSRSGGGPPKETNVPRISLTGANVPRIYQGSLPQSASSGPGKSGISGGGKGETVVQRITLTNATITRYTSASGSQPGSRGASGKGLERIEFDFQKIDY